jgi:isoleucyl-tRNA synthetase
VFNFCTGELSAVYFDIRKDALYCDATSSITPPRARARSSITSSTHLTAWLAPVMVFTMEEVWRTRNNGEFDSVHLRTFPEVPKDWQNKALAEKWGRVRELRRVVTGALELARRDKTIGASLEAAPTLHVADAEDADVFKGLDLAEISITSDAKVVTSAAPTGAFKLDDVAGAAVSFAKATGAKCARCWRVLNEVGKSAAHTASLPALRSRRRRARQTMSNLSKFQIGMLIAAIALILDQAVKLAFLFGAGWIDTLGHQPMNGIRSRSCRFSTSSWSGTKASPTACSRPKPPSTVGSWSPRLG